MDQKQTRIYQFRTLKHIPAFLKDNRPNQEEITGCVQSSLFQMWQDLHGTGKWESAYMNTENSRTSREVTVSQVKQNFNWWPSKQWKSRHQLVWDISNWQKTRHIQYRDAPDPDPDPAWIQFVDPVIDRSYRSVILKKKLTNANLSLQTLPYLQQFGHYFKLWLNKPNFREETGDRKLESPTMNANTC